MIVNMYFISHDEWSFFLEVLISETSFHTESRYSYGRSLYHLPMCHQFSESIWGVESTCSAHKRMKLHITSSSNTHTAWASGMADLINETHVVLVDYNNFFLVSKWLSMVTISRLYVYARYGNRGRKRCFGKWNLDPNQIIVLVNSMYYLTVVSLITRPSNWIDYQLQKHLINSTDGNGKNYPTQTAESAHIHVTPAEELIWPCDGIDEWLLSSCVQLSMNE